jgi:hypothetical protein
LFAALQSYRVALPLLQGFISGGDDSVPFLRDDQPPPHGTGLENVVTRLRALLKYVTRLRDLLMYEMDCFSRPLQMLTTSLRALQPYEMDCCPEKVMTRLRDLLIS